MPTESLTLVIWGLYFVFFVGLVAFLTLMVNIIVRQKDGSKIINHQPLAKRVTQFLGLACLLPGVAIVMTMGEERRVLTLPMIACGLVVFFIGCGLFLWSEPRWPSKPAA